MAPRETFRPEPPIGDGGLAALADAAVLVEAGTHCEDVERVFAGHQGLASVVVVCDGDEPKLLTQRDFAYEWAGRLGYGRALLGRAPVGRLVSEDATLIVSDVTTLSEAGVVALGRERRRHYDDIVLRTSRGLATVSVAAVFAELAREHAHRALHDPLTRLANRELFAARLRETVGRPGGQVAVLFVDLDNFKAVNDSLGHPAGDELLELVGARLADAFRGNDTVARFGGDEFAVLMSDASERAANAGAERITLALAAPVQIGARSVSVRASIGIAHSEPGLSAEGLLRNADLAMYAAKRAGKHGHAVYRRELHAQALMDLELTHDIAGALTRGELHLVYQPVVELETGRVTGAEALLRWDHPERGAIAPDDFISLAEHSGAILPIGRWVLEQACRQLAAWSRALGPTPELLVGVNVSARQFEDLGLVAHVRSTLARHGIRAPQLVLELTETALIHDDDDTRRALEELSALGVRIAIDDFGTGFSSLRRLQQLPIDVIKIDKAFIDELETSSPSGLVRGVLGLAASLGIEAVAEGIESARQLDELVDAGCEFGQGYHLGRPMSAAAVETMIAYRLGDVPAHDAARL